MVAKTGWWGGRRERDRQSWKTKIPQSFHPHWSAFAFRLQMRPVKKEFHVMALQSIRKQQGVSLVRSILPSFPSSRLNCLKYTYLGISFSLKQVICNVTCLDKI